MLNYRRKYFDLSLVGALPLSARSDLSARETQVHAIHVCLICTPAGICAALNPDVYCMCSAATQHTIIVTWQWCNNTKQGIRYLTRRFGPLLVRAVSSKQDGLPRDQRGGLPLLELSAHEQEAFVSPGPSPLSRAGTGSTSECDQESDNNSMVTATAEPSPPIHLGVDYYSAHR